MPQIVVIDPNPETRAVLERALQAQGHTVVSLASLEQASGLNGTPLETRPLKLRDIERAVIEEALEANHGNRTHAARQLGISLRKLQYRLKEYGVPNQK
jgi:DNA-binding NtrC family response regulator